MALRPSDCDRDRLRLSLEDRLTEAQQAEVADHLERCAPCRQELERMAAATRYWGDAALVRDDPSPGASSTGVIAGAVPGLESDEDNDDGDDDWLRLLDPPDPDHPESLGRLGPYPILELLGRGGMGLVFKARDPSLDRTVAIKVLTPALSHRSAARRRFNREARAIAAVGHEHIVAIHAVDEFRGLPYLVMQYVPGRSLQEKLDESGPLDVREILRIGTQAARALAAAHAQGVVHRDIKPANILLENCVERVRLTDFGLARAIDDASLTQSGVIAGTPQYMAPEQARGEPVDARADLFALGAALYAMATGRSPFRADSAMAVLKRVCEARHRPIREVNPDVPDWLEALVDRLLAKEPADRFQTAAEVADLLEKGLAHLQQPTLMPPPIVPRLAAFPANDRDRAFDSPVPAPTPGHGRLRLRRLPIAAAFVLLSAAGLGAGEAAGFTRLSEFVATILRIKTPEGTLLVKVDDPEVKVRVDGDDVVIGGTGLQEVRLRPGRHHVQAFKDGQAVRDQLVTITRGEKEIVNIEFEPAAPVAVGALVPHDAAHPPHATPDPRVPLREVLPSGAIGRDHPTPKGTLVVNIDDPNVTVKIDGDELNITGPGPQEISLPPGSHLVQSTRDGRSVRQEMVSIPEGAKHVLDIRFPSVGPNPPVASLPPLPRQPLGTGAGHGAAPRDGLPVGAGDASRARSMVWSLAFSPDGRRLAIGQQAIDRPESFLRVWDVEKHSEIFEIEHPAGYRTVAFAPDGRGLAAGLFDGTLTTLSRVGEPGYRTDENQGSPINALVFLPGSSVIAAGDWDGWVRFHGADTIANRRPLRYPGRIWSLAVSPDGSTLAVGGEAKTVQVYDLPTRQLKATLEGHDHAVESLDFSPDGTRLASAGGRTVRFWDTATWKESGEPIGHAPEVICVRFSPDGKLVAISDGESFLPHYKPLSTSIILWDVAARAEVRRLWGHTNTIWALAFSPDGKTLVSGSADQTVRFWDIASGRLREMIVPGESGTSAGMGAASGRGGGAAAAIGVAP
jgi:serine/threonine protein kinase/WD40 repeat protein